MHTYLYFLVIKGTIFKKKAQITYCNPIESSEFKVSTNAESSFKVETKLFC